MSYSCATVRCPRILRMSSSNETLSYNGHPIGDSGHDNARQINERRYRISNYRQSLASMFHTTPTPSPTSSPTTSSCERERFYLNNNSRQIVCSALNNLTMNNRAKACKTGTALLDCKVCDIEYITIQREENRSKVFTEF